MIGEIIALSVLGLGVLGGLTILISNLITGKQTFMSHRSRLYTPSSISFSHLREYENLPNNKKLQRLKKLEVIEKNSKLWN